MTSIALAPSRPRRMVLGQEPPIKVPKGAIDIRKIQDAPRVVPISEINALDLSEQEALSAYTLTQLLLSVRAKSAYVLFFTGRINQFPQVAKAWRELPFSLEADGQSHALTQFVRKLSMPRMLANLNNLRTSLETHHLPKRFGYSIRGRIPIIRYREDIRSIVDKYDYADVIVDAPKSHPSRKTIDFGDLHKSNVPSDLSAIERIISSETLPRIIPTLTGLGPVMAMSPASAVVLKMILGSPVSIIITGVAGTAFLVWFFGSMFRKGPLERALNSPEVQKAITDAIKNASPEQILAMLAASQNTKSIFGEMVDILKWVVIGTVTVGVVGVILNFVLD